MNFSIEHEQEEDGRWLAEVPELPGVLAYGTNAEEAMLKVEALALRIIAELPSDWNKGKAVPCQFIFRSLPPHEPMVIGQSETSFSGAHTH